MQDPRLESRGVGRTKLIPKEIFPPPGRVHLAAAGKFNAAKGLSESLSAVLDELSRPPPSLGLAETKYLDEAAGEAAAADGADDTPPPAPATAAVAPPPAMAPPEPVNLEQKVLPECVACELHTARNLRTRHAGLRISCSDSVRRQPPQCRARARSGWTPLMQAVRSGTLADVEILLSLGASPQTRDRHHNTPLHKAAVAGAADKIKLLTDHGAGACLAAAGTLASSTTRHDTRTSSTDAHATARAATRTLRSWCDGVARGPLSPSCGEDVVGCRHGGEQQVWSHAAARGRRRRLA